MNLELFRFVVFTPLIICIATSTLFAQRINLLRLDQVSISEVAGESFSEELLLRDGKQETATSIRIEAGQQLEIVYDFGDATLTIDDAALTTMGLGDKQATVEILTSTIAPTTGFRSLRVEPLSASRRNSRQSINFEPSATRWAIVRIVPTDKTKELAFSITELELNGYVGSPKSTYLFSESPADAIKVLARLSDSIEIKLTADEEKLFADARDGKFDEMTFAEASLLSCGVADPNQRRVLLAKIDQYEQEAKQAIPDGLSSFERGQKLLEWLHAGPFSGGYSEKQTDVSGVLNTKRFNCVSSATLYNILARRMGLDARGIEVPDHAFSILYDGTKHADIETTNALGFNPSRNRTGLERFQESTGFVYIPESNRSKRREIGEPGLVAVTYYNHGVGALAEKRHSDAIVSFFKALSLDADNKSAVKNILAALGKWSGDLYGSGEIEKTLAVLAVGRELAPEDRTLKHNQRVFWQRHVKALVKDGKPDQALKELADANKQTPSDHFAELKSWVFVLQGQALTESKDWTGALALADKGREVVEEPAARKELNDWKHYVVLAWSSELLEEMKYAEAIDVVEIGLKDSSDWKLRERLAFLAQEWALLEVKAKDAQAGYTVIKDAKKRFPDIRELDKVTAMLASKAAEEFIESKDYESAVKAFQDARKVSPDSWQIRDSEEPVWMAWAKPHLDAREWEKAVEIYERAHKSLPRSSPLEQNLAYIAQELADEVLKKDGVIAAEEVIVRMANRFPDVYGIRKQRGTRISLEVSRLFKLGQTDEAAELLSKNRKFFTSDNDYSNQVNGLYYSQAEKHLDKKEWDKAIEIFRKGLDKFPSTSRLEQNLEYCWINKAKPFVDAKKWKEAIEVYSKASESLPDSYKIRGNLKFCKSKLEK